MHHCIRTFQCALLVPKKQSQRARCSCCVIVIAKFPLTSTLAYGIAALNARFTVAEGRDAPSRPVCLGVYAKAVYASYWCCKAVCMPKRCKRCTRCIGVKSSGVGIMYAKPCVCKSGVYASSRCCKSGHEVGLFRKAALASIIQCSELRSMLTLR